MQQPYGVFKNFRRWAQILHSKRSVQDTETVKMARSQTLQGVATFGKLRAVNLAARFEGLRHLKNALHEPFKFLFQQLIFHNV